MVCHQAALVSGKLTRVYVGGQPTDALEVIMSRPVRRVVSQTKALYTWEDSCWWEEKQREVRRTRILPMSITLDLPQELESELATEATQLGLPLSEYVLRLLSTRSLVGPSPTNGAELVAYWQREGVIGTRPDIMDSQVHARQLRHKAERRRRE